MVTKKEKAAQFADQAYDIHVTGRNVMVTEAMKDYAIDKVSKVERFTDRIIDVHVTMDIQRIEHRVDIVIKVGSVLIKSHAVTDDMYASIDKAVEKLQRQLRRYKQKLTDHHARPLEVVDMRVNVLRNPTDLELDEINDAIEDETAKRAAGTFHKHEIVAEETMPLKVLTLDEAVMKMDLSGDHFLLFREESSRSLQVIYRRDDGNYGLVHPEG